MSRIYPGIAKLLAQSHLSWAGKGSDNDIYCAMAKHAMLFLDMIKQIPNPARVSHGFKAFGGDMKCPGCDRRPSVIVMPERDLTFSRERAC